MRNAEVFCNIFNKSQVFIISAESASIELRIFLFLQVQPKHVKEAFRLLNKSIIRVEQPTINFEDEEEDGQEGMRRSTC